ncbi:MAG: hypothetical protein OCD76_03230 [Reichenbachiella sp.]
MISKKNSISKLRYFMYYYKSIMIVVLLLSYISVNGQERAIKQTVNIPEPLMFDLVRGLGAKKGELEINSLADFPLNNVSSRGVEWAPEIEYALFNNFAVELELPLNNFVVEAYKSAIQWTIGSSKNNKYIHGIQIIGEKIIHDDIFELNFLYVPAYRFNEVWSVIGLFGIMVEFGSDTPIKNNTIILNASVFADLNEHTIVGIEINNSDPTFQKIDDNKMELLFLPQMHYEFDSGYSFQFGLGPKFSESGTNASAVLRGIKTF